MDEAVQRAMRKWPNVPAVFGWLALDLRGRWLIRGERVGNPLVSQFIGRNYGSDEHGRWFFQNGPQRVFVRLAYTPWVLRLDMQGALRTHTGLHVRKIRAAGLDREGIVALLTEHGAGVVDDRDVERFSATFAGPGGSSLSDDVLTEALDALHSGAEQPLYVVHDGERLLLEPLEAEQIPARFGFERDPQPLVGEQGRG